MSDWRERNRGWQDQPDWNENVGERRHGRNWLSSQGYTNEGRTPNYGDWGEYGDDRDEAFQRGQTSRQSSMINREYYGNEYPQQGNQGPTYDQEEYDRDYSWRTQQSGRWGREYDEEDYERGGRPRRMMNRDYSRDYGRGRQGSWGNQGRYEGGSAYNTGMSGWGQRRGFTRTQGDYQGYEGSGETYGGRGRVGYGREPGWGIGYDYETGQGQASQEWMRRGQHMGRGPKGYQRSDERIMEDANERLMWHGDIDASNIEVRVQNGEITLEGTVPDRWMKRLAEEAVEDIRGANDVHNNLRLQQTDQGQQQNQQGQNATQRNRQST